MHTLRLPGKVKIAFWSSVLFTVIAFILMFAKMEGSATQSLRTDMALDSIRRLETNLNRAVADDVFADKPINVNSILPVNREVIEQKKILSDSIHKRDAYAETVSTLFFLLAALFLITAIAGFALIMRDLKRTERTNKLLLFHSTLLQNISDPIVTTDAEFKITAWTKHAAELYGFTEKEAVGQTTPALLRMKLDEETLQSIRDRLNAHATWKGRVIHHHKDGHPISIEVTSSPLLDDNKFIGTISLMRDVSAAVKLEEELQFAAARLQQDVNLKSNELGKVFERITDAFIALDNDWNYSYVNEAALRFHSREKQELLGKNIWQLFPAVVDEPFYEALQEAKTTQQSIRRELYFSKEDRWFEDLIYPSADGISVYYRDITARKKAEQRVAESEAALLRSNERYVLIARATNDAFWDWDIANNKLAGNDIFSSWFGIEPGTIIRYEDFIARVHPDDRTPIESRFSAAVARSEVQLSEEFRFLRADNKLLNIFDRAYVLYNEHGEPYRMLGAMQDVSALKEIQQKLIGQKELSDSIINSLPGIFYLYNQAGKIYLWNKNLETVTGYSPREISRLHPLDFIAPEQRDVVEQKIRSVFETGNDYVEAFFLTRTGEKIPYYFTGMAINYENENCLVGVGLDISEKTRSQEELIRSHEALRELGSRNEKIREAERTHLAREIHDELGQQLTGLKMEISWLGKKIQSADDSIPEKIRGMLELIDRTVVTVRRISTTLRPSILDDLGLLPAMEWQTDEFEKRSGIKADFRSNVGHLPINPEIATNIFRIFQESLTNVVRHAHATELHSSFTLEDGMLTLKIEDNGVGFDEVEIRERKTLGLLGLKERTLLIGGSYELSGIPGKGTTVLITVPLV